MSVSRRSVLGGLAAVPAAAAATGTADPRAGADGFVKLQADLDPRRVTPWWYDVALYAVVGDAAPRLMLRAEGCETYRMQRDAAGAYRSHGATVTAFKDAVGGGWIDHFANPITGRTNAVRANVIAGASAIYPADGSVPLPDVSRLSPPPPPPSGWLRWIDSGDRIGCMIERRSNGAVQPLIETASLWTDRAGLLDPNRTRAEAIMSSAFASPWLGWMDMAGVSGHLLWYSTGRKLTSLDELPPGYRARAELLAPGRLTADPPSR